MTSRVNETDPATNFSIVQCSKTARYFCALDVLGKIICHRHKSTLGPRHSVDPDTQDYDKKISQSINLTIISHVFLGKLLKNAHVKVLLVFFKELTLVSKYKPVLNMSNYPNIFLFKYQNLKTGTEPRVLAVLKYVTATLGLSTMPYLT